LVCLGVLLVGLGWVVEIGKHAVGRLDVLLALCFFLLLRDFIDLVLNNHVRIVVQIFDSEFGIELILLRNRCFSLR